MRPASRLRRDRCRTADPTSGRLKPKLLLVSCVLDRMMDAVHVGRDDESSAARDRAARGRRTLPWLNIAVAFSSTSKISTATAGAPSDRDDRELDQHRQQDLDRMKARAGGHVEVEIGVMHPVQAPQQRHRVEHDVLQVDGKIEDDRPKRERPPDRHVEIVEHSPATARRRARRSPPPSAETAGARSGCSAPPAPGCAASARAAAASARAWAPAPPTPPSARTRRKTHPGGRPARGPAPIG